MPQKTTLHPTGVMGKPYSFSAKTEAVVIEGYVVYATATLTNAVSVAAAPTLANAVSATAVTLKPTGNNGS